MPYAFNEDRSKVDVYTEDEIDAMDFVTADQIDAMDLVKGFDTVADMQAATLEAGDICHTNGFHASGDGGAAFYKITASGTANGMDVLACGDVFANLVTTESCITPEMFGARGDGTTDDSQYFVGMFNYISSRSKNIVLINKYKIEVVAPSTNINYKTVNIYGCNNAEIIGSITFGEVFQHLFVEGVTFKPGANDYSLYLNLLNTLEYKTVKISNCNFVGENTGINIDTRSLVCEINTCTFQGALPAVVCTNVDRLSFVNCWFDSKISLVGSTYNSTVIHNGTLESATIFERCALINATTNLGTFNCINWLSTVGQVFFTDTRMSNEGNTVCYAVEYRATTEETYSGHDSGASFNGCDITIRLCNLLGLPSFIFVNNTAINNPYLIDCDIPEPWKIRPALKISYNIQGITLKATRKYGFSNNKYGINMTLTEPPIPFSLFYALDKYNSNTDNPLIVPLGDFYAYSISPNTTTPLFKLISQGTTYNMSVNIKPIAVSYVTQEQGVSAYKSCIDFISLDLNNLQVESSRVFEIGNVSYSITYDSTESSYTVSITSSSRLLSKLDYAFIDSVKSTL